MASTLKSLNFFRYFATVAQIPHSSYDFSMEHQYLKTTIGKIHAAIVTPSMFIVFIGFSGTDIDDYIEGALIN